MQASVTALAQCVHRFERFAAVLRRDCDHNARLQTGKQIAESAHAQHATRDTRQAHLAHFDGAESMQHCDALDLPPRANLGAQCPKNMTTERGCPTVSRALELFLRHRLVRLILQSQHLLVLKVIARRANKSANRASTAHAFASAERLSSPVISHNGVRVKILQLLTRKQHKIRICAVLALRRAGTCKRQRIRTALHYCFCALL